MRLTFVAALCWLLGLLAPPPAEATETGAEARSQGPLAYVSVAGAPGDGEQALAAALTRRLSAIGVKQATAFEANVYDVQGTVRVTAAQGGKQSVRIVWVVLGPDGTQLGVVSQTKDVRKGALDKRWGAAADAAAEAAADDIAKLLPH
jgi:hypothetical protein